MNYNRRQFLKLAGLGALALSAKQCAKKSPPNVLMIAVDDLRPELGCYGEEQIHSPNIDQLAAKGTRFARSHCNVPVCGASRASLLTGVRPTWNRFVSWDVWADKDLPGHLSLPRHLKNNGYYTVSLGKVFHHKTDDLDGWSEKPWRPTSDKWLSRLAYIAEDSKKRARHTPRKGLPDWISGPAWEHPDCDDSDYPDGMIADRAIADLKRLSQQEQPFFLAAGFLKPHLPFNAPQKYWDLYDHDQIKLADNPYPPENAPNVAIHNSGELRNGYLDVPPENPLPDDYARWLVHGYYACVSYIDAQIGRVLQALEDLGLANNTIVMLWGDHGWNLGEHTMWCKHNNFETSLGAPIIVRAPGYEPNQTSDGLVEFVDIYPTLVDLCGLSIPGHCEGSSFVPLMKNPDKPWKKAVFSRWIKGDTVTTERYQYTEWRDTVDGPVTARMLYDHEKDPAENVNVAGDPDYSQVVAEMHQLLANGWQAVRI